MRAERAAANVSSTSPDALSSTYPPKSSLGGAPASRSGSIVWAPVGPAPLASDATGDGAQDYNWLSGRAISILIDPADTPGNSNVVLVGTGETNSSGDSYYGLGILRSADAGTAWTPTQSAGTGQSFLGIGFSKIAFSTAIPNLVVAATAGDNGLYVR
jgi:hypothetical protein